MPDGAGFRHFRRADEPRPDRNGHSNGHAARPIPNIDWLALNAEFVANLTGDDVLDLAAAIRLPVEAIGEIEVGVEWYGETRIYTFPERSGTGEIIGIALAISIASGSPFLGTFRVPVKLRVSYVSGESGRPTTQETARRICKAKGFDLRSLGDTLNFNFACPTLSDPKVMEELATQLSRTRPDVAFPDPFYLALGSADPRNMFEVGACLRTAMGILGAGGATVFIVHHANRTLPLGQAMELTHLAYSGVEQFCRQWLLVSRDSPYLDDGRHELTIRSGGLGRPRGPLGGSNRRRDSRGGIRRPPVASRRCHARRSGG